MGAHRSRRAVGVVATVIWIAGCSAGSGTADSTRLCDALADVQQSYAGLAGLLAGGNGDAATAIVDVQAGADQLTAVASGEMRNAARSYAAATDDLADLLAAYDFQIAAATADPKLGEILNDADAADALTQLSSEAGSRCDASPMTVMAVPSTVAVVPSDSLSTSVPAAPQPAPAPAETTPVVVDSVAPPAIETTAPLGAETSVESVPASVAPVPDPVPAVDTLAPLPTTPVADPGSIDVIVSALLGGAGATAEQAVCVREGLLGVFGEARLIEMLQTASSTPDEDAAAAEILRGCGLDPAAILGLPA